MTDEDNEYKRSQENTLDLVSEVLDEAVMELTWDTDKMGETTTAVIALVRAKLRALRAELAAQWAADARRALDADKTPQDGVA
jgi:hypothetical protein